MAWWNQPEGSVTPTVTLRRLAAWLAERGYAYDIDLSEGLVRSSVAGFDYVLMVVDRRILAVRAHHELSGLVPSTAALSRVRAVAQEVSSGRLIPALYTEVDDAGLSLCAEVLTNIGAGLDDAQLAGTMDFLLDGVDEALREVLSLLDEDAESEAEVSAEVGFEAEADATAVDVEPEADSSGESPEQVTPDVVEPVEEQETAAVSLPDATETLVMAAVVDGPETDAHAQSPAEAGSGLEAEPDLGVKSDERMISLGDAEGGTGVETTDTPEPLLVS